MLNLILFILYCFLLIYTLIVTYLETNKRIFNPSTKYHLKPIEKVFMSIFSIIFLYFLALNNFKYNYNFTYFKYALLLFTYTYIPQTWGFFISTLLIKKNINSEIVTNIFTQLLLSALLFYYGFKHTHFTIYTLIIAILVSLCLGLIIYKIQLKKIKSIKHK
ncbi:MAG TPA: hypothetical protein DC000_05220 [Clostridiales bacterium]|nr:hypothetical protein [Clostridiales bacterium]